MRQKVTFIEVAAVILLFLTALIAFLGNGATKDYGKDKIIIAFGDSLTAGYGVVSPGKNYVVFLSEMLKIPVINAGVTGDNTSDALVRLKEDVLDKNPDVVTVLLGGNDFFGGYSEEVVKANLRTIIRRIKKTGAKVILIGGSKQLLPNFELTFERLAFDEGVDGYVPNILGGILLRKDLRFDGVHPNERGHKIMAERILPVLERVLRSLDE